VNLPNLPIFLALTNIRKAITSRDFESVLGLTNDAESQAEKARLQGLINVLELSDPEPSLSESIETFTPSEWPGELT
jgi:hypothetical protein